MAFRPGSIATRLRFPNLASIDRFIGGLQTWGYRFVGWERGASGSHAGPLEAPGYGQTDDHRWVIVNTTITVALFPDALGKGGRVDAEHLLTMLAEEAGSCGAETIGELVTIP